ncbi:MAG: hypothetical protein Q9167_004258 [Letrouitia subvulpina]
MAANYWASTQRQHWVFSRENLRAIRHGLESEDSDLAKQYPIVDWRLLSIFFNQQLGKLGKCMQVKQQALATAQVYIRRFYIKVELRRTNPYLVLATALYLACKMEECPQYIRNVANQARNLWPDFIPSDVSKLGECEFHLISEMNSQLIVHHPYRALQELQSKLNLSQDDISLTCSIIDDHYFTDLPLLMPPHIVAITAIFLSLTLKPNQGGLQSAASVAAILANAPQASKENTTSAATILNTSQKKLEFLVNWLVESEVDIQAIVDSIQEIVSLYGIWEQYSEKTCKEQISRFVKAVGQEK